MNMMLIFDVLVAILGGIIVFQGVGMKRSGRIPGLFIPPEEMKKCSDQPGFAAFLFPRAFAFGLTCILFGIQGLVNDLFAAMHWAVNLGMIVLFLAAWVWFSLQLRQGRKRFLETT